jgi:hypothetical protein
MSKTNLGQFLYSERIRRGYESISEYLKNYTNIPISEPYYRDIESGRKKIKADKAETLCKALKLNKKEFYYHLLCNVLPSDILKDLLKPIASTTFKVASEEFNKLDQKIVVLRKAYEKRLVEEPYIVDKEIVKYLDENFEVLPLIHFIYMRKICTFEELMEIMRKNNIKKPFTQIIHEFKKYNIAMINHEEKTIARYRKIFKIPKNDMGIRLKDRFLKTEIDEAIQAPDREQIIGPQNTFVYSGIVCIKNGDSLRRTSDKLTELLAELEVEHSSLDESEAVPYFVSFIFSSREKYNVDNQEGVNIKKQRRRTIIKS